MSEWKYQSWWLFARKGYRFLAKEISPWRNRQLSSGYLSGSKKYQVLKNAKFRCLLCGISASEAPLTVDHIVPRKLGGSDDLSNLQALCHQCNSRKQATDDVDFRGVAGSYHVREKGCPFCELPGTERLSVNELCYSTHAKPPVTEGHTLIVPKRHVTDYFDLYQPELNTIQQMLLKQKAIQEEQDKSITAFNVVIESGEDARSIHSPLPRPFSSPKERRQSVPWFGS